jgi:hypothetical protein
MNPNSMRAALPFARVGREIFLDQNPENSTIIKKL